MIRLAFAKQTTLGKMRVQAFKEDSVPRLAQGEIGLYGGLHIVSRAARGKKKAAATTASKVRKHVA